MAYFEKRSAKDGSVSWRAQIRRRGESVAATFPTREEAEDWAGAVETDIRRGRYFGGAADRAVYELLDRYLLEELGHLAESEQRKRRIQIEWWRQQVGGYQVQDFSRAVVKAALGRLRAGDGPSGKGVSSTTVDRYKAALSRVFSLAIAEWEWARENPLRGLEKRTSKADRSKRFAGRFLSTDERDRLFEACREHPCRELYPIVLLALHTGGRQSEILSLRWRNIDFERRRGTFVGTDTKNGETRSFRLTEMAAAVLRDYGRVRRLGSDRLFEKFPESQWRTARKRAKLDAPFRFHDLRHTFASYLAMSGEATLLEIKQAGGWKTLDMVLRYAHLMPGQADDVIDKVFGS